MQYLHNWYVVPRPFEKEPDQLGIANCFLGYWPKPLWIGARGGGSVDGAGWGRGSDGGAVAAGIHNKMDRSSELLIWQLINPSTGRCGRLRFRCPKEDRPEMTDNRYRGEGGQIFHVNAAWWVRQILIYVSCMVQRLRSCMSVGMGGIPWRTSMLKWIANFISRFMWVIQKLD